MAHRIDDGPRSRERHQQERELLPHQGPYAQPAEPTKRVDVEDEERAHERQRGPLGEQGGRERDRCDPDETAAGGPLGLDGAEVDPRREQHEGGAEQIRPAGDPGHRLDPERVNAKYERGDRGGRAQVGSAPARLRATGARGGEQPPGHEVEEGHVDGVQQHVHQVIAPGLHPAEDPVEAPGEAGQRDVVAEGHARERPADMRAVEPAEGEILEKVQVVVPVEERAGQGGQEGRRGQDRNGQRGEPADHRNLGGRPGSARNCASRCFAAASSGRSAAARSRCGPA